MSTFDCHPVRCFLEFYSLTLEKISSKQQLCDLRLLSRPDILESFPRNPKLTTLQRGPHQGCFRCHVLAEAWMLQKKEWHESGRVPCSTGTRFQGCSQNWDLGEKSTHQSSCKETCNHLRQNENRNLPFGQICDP